jgi:hypothetical protein
MKPQNSRHEFETLLRQRELALTALAVDLACTAMLDFYRSQRADGCDVSADGDMLLYQWNVVTRDGLGSCLEWNLTRQFSLAESSDGENDDATNDEEEIDANDTSDDDESSDDELIWQLSLTMRFPLKNSAEALSAGNKWCPTPRPQAVDHFEKFIRESPAYKLAATRTAEKVELDFFNAG